MSAEFRTRIAPTPSGLLHPGNAVSFLLTWAIARAKQGSIFLRIDDLDAARMRPKYLEDIFRSLEWLGIDYDEGPSGPDDFHNNFSQQLRIERYQKFLQQLRIAGQLYVCSCSRKQIRTASKDGLYPGTCRNLNRSWETPGTAWRLLVPEGTIIRIPEWNSPAVIVNLDQEIGDVVLKRKRGLPAYQIASLADDVQWNINFIVRGDDLLTSSAMQLYLARLLQLPIFPNATFFHHPLITNEAGEKMSKSKGAGSLKAWRENNRSPLELYQATGIMLGIEKEKIQSKADLLDMVKQAITQSSS